MDVRVEMSIARGAEALFAVQRADGSWPDDRPTAVLGTAGAVVALRFADAERSRDLVDAGVRWLLDVQNTDGGWGGVPGAATQLVPTAVAATAIHLIDPSSEDPVRRALDVVESYGGVESLQDAGMARLVRTFRTLADLDTLRGTRRVPLELLLLPARFWRTRLSFRVAPFVAMAFVQARYDPPRGVGALLDRLARRTGLRVLADVERGEQRLGGYGGDNWLAALVCIGLTCVNAPQRTIDDAVDYLRSNARADGSWHIMQGLDLIGGAYVARGMADAGFETRRARQWLRDCQQDRPFPVYGTPPGGWGWEGPRGWPNFLDSAVVLSALRPSERASGLRWIESRQNRDGSWGTFVPDTTLPNDGPCPYVTAQCVEVLLDSGASPQGAVVRPALDWLLTHQRPDGTYPALWYSGPVPGTATALVAFGRAGLADHPVARKAADALLRTRLADGSWGTVEDTAWALRGLLAAGVPAVDLRRAADWIVAAQRPDGRWPASPVCMHIRDLAYYVDGLIADGLALSALGNYRRSLAGSPLQEQGEQA